MKSLVLWKQEYTPLPEEDFLGEIKTYVDLQTKLLVAVPTEKAWSAVWYFIFFYHNFLRV